MTHLLVAQSVLQRPIEFAQPVDGGDRHWHLQTLNDIIGHYVLAAGFEFPSAPEGAPLRLLPTQMHETSVPLGNLTHWDPVLPVPHEQASMTADEYESFFYQSRFANEQDNAFWKGLLAADAAAYNGAENKENMVAQERAAMDTRCRKWARQARKLWEELNFSMYLLSRACPTSSPSWPSLRRLKCGACYCNCVCLCVCVCV